MAEAMPFHVPFVIPRDFSPEESAVGPKADSSLILGASRLRMARNDRMLKVRRKGPEGNLSGLAGLR